MSSKSVEVSRLQRLLRWPILVAYVVSMVMFLFDVVISLWAYGILMVLTVLCYDETQPLLGRLGRLFRRGRS
jgi:hypothetical protein